MCRLLFVKTEQEFDIRPHLRSFARVAQASKEYQGHGWGCAYLQNGEWTLYRNIKPIWQDDLTQFPPTTRLLAHVRSAFENKGIAIENNMPFYGKGYVFAFNGELRGVRIKQEGKTGAEKIFNLLLRLPRRQMSETLATAIRILKKQTHFVRASNIIVADKEGACVASLFNEDPEYFTLHYKQSANESVLCSAPYPGETGWHKLRNDSLTTF